VRRAPRPEGRLASRLVRMSHGGQGGTARSLRGMAPAPSPMKALPDAVPAGAAGSVAIADLFSAALDAIVLIDAAGRVTAWNDRAEQTFGWSADDAIGERLSRLVGPAPLRLDPERGPRRVQGSGWSSLIGQRVQLSWRHRDGRAIPVELTICRVGGSRTLAGFVRDLSREEEAEQARLEAETRYRSLVERLPGIAYVDEIGGDTRFVSPQLDAILGYRPEEWTFELWRSKVHRSDRPSVLAALARGEASDDPFTLLYRIRARDGRWLRIRDEAVVVIEPDGRRSVHGVMFDVTRELSVELELKAANRERGQVTASLRRLEARGTPEETAAAICTEIARMRFVDMAMINVFDPDGSVTPIAAEVPPGVPISVGYPLPATRAAYLRESATGPWVDEWTAVPADDEYLRRWMEVGLTCSAYVPFGVGGEVYGLVVAGTTARIGSEAVTRWLPSLAEYAAVAGALLVPALTRRWATADIVGPIRRAIDTHGFETYVQPVVELQSRTVVGYEALTRFADGTQPEKRFADADTVGLGPELEVACLRGALEAAQHLPAGRWLSINLSPGVLGVLSEPALLAEHRDRAIVVELTERLEISDYSTVRRDLDRIAGAVEVAVDDAGAGFASLRHIVELHPRYVKLDRRLVRAIDRDPARQALVAGMVYFARETDCILVAEGIETEAERRILSQLGVSFGQGYLFGRPVPVRDVEPQAR
jgi:PAS domain S-box-containing protein